MGEGRYAGLQVGMGTSWELWGNVVGKEGQGTQAVMVCGRAWKGGGSTRVGTNKVQG